MTRVVVGLESVLQHSVVYCNREGWQQGAVYCNTLHCIVAGRAASGRRGAQGCRRAGARRVVGARGRADPRSAAGEWGTWQASERGARQAGSRGPRGALQAGAVRAAMRSLGVLLANGLCTWYTRPVFGLV